MFPEFGHRECSTLVGLVRLRAESPESEAGYTFLQDGEEPSETLSYSALYRRARAIAAALQAVGAPGDRAILLLAPGLEYIASFFGCLFAGIIAVPAYPPRNTRNLERIVSMLHDSGATICLTSSDMRPSVERLLATTDEAPRLRWVTPDTVFDDLASAWKDPNCTGESLAFLQYTSGSTANPRGVMVTHRNLLGNQRMLAEAYGSTPDSVSVGWLPMFHDMGLIGTVLQPLYVGASATLMPPTAFIQSPVRWLRTISRTRARVSAGPNFAYELCVQAVAERNGLDLSSWDVAISGAEPVRAGTLERFAEAFAPCGFRREAFSPSYGLAEATLFVSGKRPGLGPAVATFQVDALEHHRVAPTTGKDAVRALVSCGTPAGGLDVRVVDTETRLPCGEDRVGELWISGESVAQGYWNRPDESRDTFRACLDSASEPRFLRTGDLGFLHHGEVFITGRLKDLIIIRGRNLAPQDIELTVERSHPALNPGAGAAFALDEAGEEQLVVVQEVRRTHRNADMDDVIRTVRRAIAQEHEVQAYTVVLVKPGGVPKTSSGKIQRGRCREEYLRGVLAVVARSVASEEHESVGRSELKAPRNATEEVLCRIWCDVLRVDQVSIEDDFFELGGDSLLAMQVIARAHEAKLAITVEHLFAHPTIADLARIAPRRARGLKSQQEVEGSVPLTPMQHEYLDQNDHPNGGSARMLFEARNRIDPEVLDEAVSHLLRHHDALRMRFFREGSHWRQVNLATEDHHVVRHVDLSSLSEAEQAAAVREEERTLRRSIDVSTGPLIRVAVFSRGPRADILMLLVHHLVVDGYSWSILMEDLETLYGRLLAGKMPSLPAKTTSFKTWSETLAAFAKSAQAADELPFWLGLPANHVQHLPVDYPDAVDPGERAGVATTILSPFETTALVRSVPTDHKARLSDIIVTALARALAAWTGAPVQAMDVNSHGREPVFPNVDLSRTVGWFVTRYPVVINLGSASEPVESLQTVKRQLLAIPRSGLGYGILRHLSPYGSCLDAIDVLPEFHLNYQGQLDLLFARMSLFKPIQEPSRPPKRWLPQTTRRVFARIRLREKQLELAFAYSRRSYEPSTIDHFVGLVAAELQCLIASSTRQPFDNTE